jgi:hypothetical protein
VDDVQPEEQWDVHAALLDGEMLHPIDFLGIRQPQNGADPTVTDFVVRRTRHGASEAYSCSENELPDLLLECHFLEK